MSAISPDKEACRLRRSTKVVYIFALCLFPIAALTMGLSALMGFILVSPSGYPLLDLPQILLGSASIIFLIIGLFWPRLAGWNKKAYVNEVELLYGHVMRVIFFASPVIYGFILYILGSEWYIVLPIYILEFIALIWTFPTTKRLAKWQEKKRPLP